MYTFHPLTRVPSARSAGPFLPPVDTCVPSPQGAGPLPPIVEMCAHVIVALVLDVTLEYQSNWMLT
eukprot:2674774-Karenia_brevis.AAC.1